MIRTKLHTLGLFPPASGEAVKECVCVWEGWVAEKERADAKKGGMFREMGGQRRCDCKSGRRVSVPA